MFNFRALRPLIMQTRLGSGHHGSNGGSQRGTTGIEHAESLHQLGTKNRTPASAYKSSKYFSYNQWSYYDAEIEMANFRLPQPDPQVPDKPRDTIKNTEIKA